MNKYKDQLEENKRKLLKALHHLEYSYSKTQDLPTDVEQLDEETLETWESFSARFGRVADIFIEKYLRTLILMNDPGFTGTLRDRLNQAEKLRLVDDANIWLAIRELRNIAAHEYTEEELGHFFQRIRKECPKLLALKKILS